MNAWRAQGKSACLLMAKTAKSEMQLTRRQFCRYETAGSTADKISRIIIQLNATLPKSEVRRSLLLPFSSEQISWDIRGLHDSPDFSVVSIASVFWATTAYLVVNPGQSKLHFVYSLLNKKTVILLNHEQYRLILVNSVYMQPRRLKIMWGFSTRFRWIWKYIINYIISLLIHITPCVGDNISVFVFQFFQLTVRAKQMEITRTQTTAMVT